jgi:hypothetical protein
VTISQRYRRAVLREGQEAEALAEEMERLEMEIAVVEATLEKERALISLALFGHGDEHANEVSNLIQ